MVVRKMSSLGEPTFKKFLRYFQISCAKQATSYFLSRISAEGKLKFKMGPFVNDVTQTLSPCFGHAFTQKPS